MRIKVNFLILLIQIVILTNCVNGNAVNKNKQCSHRLLRYIPKIGQKKLFWDLKTIEQTCYKNYNRFYSKLKSFYVPLSFESALSFLFINSTKGDKKLKKYDNNVGWKKDSTKSDKKLKKYDNNVGWKKDSTKSDKKPNISNQNLGWKKVGRNFSDAYYTGGTVGSLYRSETYKNLNANDKITRIVLLGYNEGTLKIELGDLHEISKEMATKIKNEFILGNSEYDEYLGTYCLSVSSIKDIEVLKKFIDYIDIELSYNGHHLLDTKTKMSIKKSLGSTIINYSEYYSRPYRLEMVYKISYIYDKMEDEDMVPEEKLSKNVRPS